MEGLVSIVAVGGPDIHPLPGWIRNAPPRMAAYPAFVGLQGRSFRRSLCLARACFPSSSRIELDVSHTRSAKTLVPQESLSNTQINADEDIIISSEEEIQGLQWELRRVCSVISDWFSGLDQQGFLKNRRELKRRIGRAGLLLVTAALFLVNVSGRYSRPALAVVGPRPYHHVTAEDLEDKVKGKDIWGDPKWPLERKEEVLIEYLKTYPTDIHALKVVLYWKFVKAQLHEFLGEFDEARQGYQELLEATPLSVRALQGLAMVMHKCGEDTAMVEMLEGALQRADKFQEALEHYERVTVEDPNDFRAYLCQGIVYNTLGKRDEAEQQFEKCQNLVPQNFPHRGFIEDLILAAKTGSIKDSDRRKKLSQLLEKRKKASKPTKQPSKGRDILDLPESDS